jgi:putative hydrolase of the HAD superfamily
VIDAVLFDLDDTLFDHAHCARSALQAVRRVHPALDQVDEGELESRHSAILEELHARVLTGGIDLDSARRERFRRLLESAGAVVDDGVAQRAAAAYRDCYIRSWREVAGATALLDALRARDVRVGVVTNNLAKEQMAKLAFCGLDGRVDAVVISEEAGVTKPDPRIFRLALERLGVERDRVVMLGDSWEIDVRGAVAAGIRAVWFNPMGRSRPSPLPRVPEIRSLEPVAAVLSILLGAGSPDAETDASDAS